MKNFIYLLINIRNFFKKFFITYTVFDSGQPINLQYRNVTNEEKMCAIFGHNNFILLENYGNEGIVVESLNGKAYEAILRESANNPFRIGGINFHFNVNEFDQYKTRCLDLIKRTSPSRTMKTRWVILNSLDPYQFQLNIIGINRFNNEEIDGDTYFEFPIMANSTIQFSILTLIERKVRYFEYKRIVNSNKPRINKQFHLHEFFKQLFKIK